MRKNFFIMITLFLFSAATIAQVPQLFKYQGLARDSSGNPISNDTIALRISIHQGAPVGTVLYKETHRPVTNEFGSFNINIGAGTVVTGNFSTIPWGRYNYFQEVEMDVTGGTSFISMGTSQYLSVPYSFSSDSALHGIAPFRVYNSLDDTTEAAAAIIAFANTTGDGAPAIYVRNLGTGPSLIVNGRTILGGNVDVSGSIKVNGETLNGGFSNLQVFNSSGTFTVPTGITKVMVELWGGGGGGGGGGSSDTSLTYGGTGGGGGGGGYVKDILNVNSGESISIIVGNGGSGGPGGSGNLNYPFHYGFPGDNGGNTSFGTTTAGGGVGGNGGNAGTHNGNGNGGSGGAGGNAPGLLGIVGQFGFDANYSGFGGSSANGGFGGNPGGSKTPGGGGSGGIGHYGGVYGNAGTSGGNGRVIVWW
jgi:hypothetical protein